MQSEVQINSGISEQSFETILKAFKDFSEIESTVLFGSRAIGSFKKGSDIDIAIYGQNLTPQSVKHFISTKMHLSPISWILLLQNLGEVPKMFNLAIGYNFAL